MRPTEALLRAALAGLLLLREPLLALPACGAALLYLGWHWRTTRAGRG